MGGGSSEKAFEQEEYDNYGGSFEAEGRFTKPVEQFQQEYTFSNSRSPKVQHRKKGDIAVECIADGTTDPTFKLTTNEGYSASSTCSESSLDASVSNSTDSDGSDGFQPIDVTEFETGHANGNQNRPPFLEHPILVKSRDSLTKSFKLDRSIDVGDAQSVSSSSSGCSVDGSTSSFSVSSTSSSGFWEGTIDSRKPRTNALNNTAKSPSSDHVDRNMSNHRSSLCSDSLGNTHPPYSKTAISDHAGPTTSGIKKPIDKAALSEISSKDGLKPRKLLSRISVMSEHMDVDPSNDSPIKKSMELKNLSSSASAYPVSTDGWHSVGKDAKRGSSFLPLKPERSNHVVNDTSSTLHSLKSREVVSLSSSKSSDADLSSTSGRYSAQFPKPVKDDDDKPRASACSSHSAGYSQNVKNGLKTSMSKVVDHLKASKFSRHYPLGAGSEIAARHNKKVWLEYSVLLYLLDACTINFRM